ncbi:T9SS type A sorting domain-containing protein [Polaribacter sp. R77954]|uniref:T9SS type A sorting domain-containing protein n=1 Tax=Polaribacter sp. R77954 TaxID=3093870 RepID=UPI0037C772E6
MKQIYNYFFFFGCLILFSHTANSQIATSLDAEKRDVSSLSIGFNRRSDVGTWWTNTSFKDLLAEINPDVVRYPAGTQANYWNWKTGQFLENTDKSWGSKEIVTIPTFLNALQTRTKVVYVVNMARPTPATGINVNASEQVLKSNTTLNLKIADMITAINNFASHGKVPFAIELGNEFYFGNEESGIFHIEEINGKYYSGWDATNNKPYESSDKKQATVINAKFYLEQCKVIVEQISAAYPDIKFALTTTKEGENAQTRERWNTTIFNELNSNTKYATLKSKIHAVTQHHYLNQNYGIQTKIDDVDSAKKAIVEGIQYPLDKTSDYNLVPNNYKIWYTEYGEVKGIAKETWADALRYAALTYSWIILGEKVEHLHFHYITDNTVIKEGNTMNLAPVGIASKLFLQASAEMQFMQKIHFDSNVIAADNINSIHGLKFSNDKKETLMILNLGSNNRTIQFNNLIDYSGKPTLTQYRSLEPWVTPVALGDANIKFNNEEISETVLARKFSISVIEVPKETLNTHEVKFNKVSVFPNPVKNKLNFSTKNNIKSVDIYNLNGVRISIFKNISDNVIHVNHIKTGVYILKVVTDKATEFKKIIKI